MSRDPRPGLPADERDASARFSRLPAPIHPEDTIAMIAVDPPPDPTMGRDIETERALLWS